MIFNFDNDGDDVEDDDVVGCSVDFGNVIIFDNNAHVDYGITIMTVAIQTLGIMRIVMMIKTDNKKDDENDDDKIINVMMTLWYTW